VSRNVTLKKTSEHVATSFSLSGRSDEEITGHVFEFPNMKYAHPVGNVIILAFCLGLRLRDVTNRDSPLKASYMRTLNVGCWLLGILGQNLCSEFENFVQLNVSTPKSQRVVSQWREHPFHYLTLTLPPRLLHCGASDLILLPSIIVHSNPLVVEEGINLSASCRA
jgi:hypothetical protein